jgi:hypothetical protein
MDFTAGAKSFIKERSINLCCAANSHIMPDTMRVVNPLTPEEIKTIEGVK